ncbi:isoprenyl transferase [Aquibacillus sediminis]|uniref:isoprenyl transferase n=1 Tax=Aquibacillus sediminis TaxID=2574734 RepID=UPI0011091981|nr:isoprenyl transferase [Aquibacillus sediminis]
MAKIRLPFFNKKNDKELNLLPNGKIPEHVAIIMDGNGRWAKKRGLPRVAGHKQGMDTVKTIVKVANKHKIKVLTLYAFSTENWKRPKSEVDFIMKLPKEFLNTYLPDLMKENVQIRTIGDDGQLPQHTIEAVKYAKERTKGNTGLILNFALNYGSRYEMVEAMKQLVMDVEDQKLQIDDINESLFEDYLYTKNISDPDLLIRTSGEQRLSNFLLWQAAYSEFWFTDVLWPDFSAEKFEEALFDYQNRKRRFGSI